MSVPAPAFTILLTEPPPFAMTPLPRLPVPLKVKVLLVALLDRLSVFDIVRVPPDMLFVRVGETIFVKVPLSSRLFEPVKLHCQLLQSFRYWQMALTPLRSVEAEVVTPFHATVLEPKAD